MRGLADGAGPGGPWGGLGLCSKGGRSSGEIWEEEGYGQTWVLTSTPWWWLLCEDRLGKGEGKI